MTLGLNIGLKGIQSSQRALETLGHNITNANTPGYSRQTLDLRASRPLDQIGVIVGTGVDAEGVRRIADDVLNRRLVGQAGVVARYEGLTEILSTLESLFSEPGGSGIGEAYNTFFESASALASNPRDGVLRGALVDSAENLSSSFNQLFASVSELGDDSIAQAEALSTGINELSAEVASLNVEIGQIEAGGGVANDLRDQRDLALIQLGALIEVDVQPKPSGVVHVLVEGQLLVGSSQSYEVAADVDDSGAPILNLEGGTRSVQPAGGELGGIQHFIDDILPGLQDDINGLVRATILEVNRAHSVGIAQDGGYTSLVSALPLGSDGADFLLNEPLASLDLDFPVQDGQLRINVANDATGDLTVHLVDIDPDQMTVQELIDEIGEIPNVQAGLDSAGRLTVSSNSGYRFDFSARVDPNPDDLGTFGSGYASVVATGAGPYSFVDGDGIDLVGALGPITVTVNAADFADNTTVTAEELASVLNSNVELASGQIQVESLGGKLVLQSTATGSDATFGITGGSIAGIVGLTPGATVTGSDTPVNPVLTGTFTGEGNHTWTFRPTIDGTIGATPDLLVEVVDELGQPVASLSVGDGYTPGSEISIADGVSVRFDFGQVSASDGDVFQASVVEDSDTADILVATGLNAFFQGGDAETFAVAQSILDDPSQLAISATGATGDNGALLKLLELQDSDVASLGSTLTGAYGTLVSGVGSEVSSAGTRLATEEGLLQSLEERRQAVSGVNVDEELVDMIRFEQAFGAAARYINVVQQLGDTLLSLL